MSSGQKKDGEKTWRWDEKVQKLFQRKDKQKTYDELCERLDAKEGERAVYHWVKPSD